MQKTKTNNKTAGEAMVASPFVFGGCPPFFWLLYSAVTRRCIPSVGR